MDQELIRKWTRSGLRNEPEMYSGWRTNECSFGSEMDADSDQRCHKVWITIELAFGQEMISEWVKKLTQIRRREINKLWIRKGIRVGSQMHMFNNL